METEIEKIRYNISQADKYRSMAVKWKRMADLVRSVQSVGSETLLIKIPAHVSFFGIHHKEDRLELDADQVQALRAFLIEYAAKYDRSADGYEREVVGK